MLGWKPQLASNGNGLVIAISYSNTDEVYRSTNHGNTWTMHTITNPYPSYCRVFWDDYHNRFVMIGGTNAMYWVSSDGISWTESNLSADSTTLTAFANDDLGNAVMMNNKTPEIWFTNNGGLSWSQTTNITESNGSSGNKTTGWPSTPFSSGAEHGKTIRNGSIWVFGAGYNNLWYSSDMVNWTAVWDKGGWVGETSGRIFVEVDYGKLFYSDDNAVTWTQSLEYRNLVGGNNDTAFGGICVSSGGIVSIVKRNADGDDPIRLGSAVASGG